MKTVKKKKQLAAGEKPAARGGEKSSAYDGEDHDRPDRGYRHRLLPEIRVIGSGGSTRDCPRKHHPAKHSRHREEADADRPDRNGRPDQPSLRFELLRVSPGYLIRFAGISHLSDQYCNPRFRSNAFPRQRLSLLKPLSIRWVMAISSPERAGIRLQSLLESFPGSRIAVGLIIV